MRLFLVPNWAERALFGKFYFCFPPPTIKTAAHYTTEFYRIVDFWEIVEHNNSLGHDKIGEFGQILGPAAGVPEVLLSF
jgi:hypothetical protein